MGAKRTNPTAIINAKIWNAILQLSYLLIIMAVIPKPIIVPIGEHKSAADIHIDLDFLSANASI